MILLAKSLLLLFHGTTFASFTLNDVTFLCKRSMYPLIIFEEGKFWDDDLQAI